MRSINVLLDMLRYKRPAGSRAEAAFIRKFLLPLGGMYDRWGNVHVRVGDGAGIFSAHTDTVHHASGYQDITVQDGIVRLKDRTAKATFGDCLGADNAAGCWVLMNMIEAQVPGWYIFHRAEERGGIGSMALARHLETRLDFYAPFAVAFDRRGTTDVITHQGGGRCSSDVFAYALACELGRAYAPSDRGLFTDTANYTYIVPECTNVSVGYYNEHGSNESLDLEHVQYVAQRACEIDWQGLPIVRDPEKDDIECWFEEDWRIK